MKIKKGDTYHDVIRWESGECKFLAASLIPGAPVSFSSADHSLPDGWFVQVDGHPQIDSCKWYPIKVVSDNQFAIACMNGTQFQAKSVVVRYNKPVDLTGYSARMQIKQRVGGTVLVELTSDATIGNPRIMIDDSAKTISREIPASVTSGFDWSRAVYDLEMINGDFVQTIDGGDVIVSNEVTT